MSKSSERISLVYYMRTNPEQYFYKEWGLIDMSPFVRGVSFYTVRNTVEQAVWNGVGSSVQQDFADNWLPWRVQDGIQQ